MREILFRGKRVDNGEWIEGNLIIEDKEYYISNGSIDIELDSDFYEHSYGNHPSSEDFHFTNIYKIIPETVGQYTGLTDKNGKNIFEGDICKDRYGFVGVVEYFDEFGGFVVKHEYKDRIVSIQLDVNRNKFEVVGNIFDNPELLK